MYKNFIVFFTAFFLLVNFSVLANLADTLEKIKPAIVGVGIHTPTGRPQNVIQGSGFVIGNGHYVITNHHVLPKELDEEKLQVMAVFIGSGKSAKVRLAEIIDVDDYHDLAILKISGQALPTIKLASDSFQREGSYVGFTGFPIGSILGLYPVTHRGIISAITPMIVPVADARQISVKMLKRMRDPYMVYQLDATAYPGNSGSAMYNIDNGEVIGIINKVFVQETKEAVIEHPSGISYAIPVKYLRALLTKNKISY